MNDLSKTIAAVSTPRGKGGIATIRISGADALRVGDRILAPVRGGSFSESKPRSAVFCHILSPTPDGQEEIDDGIGIFFRAPHSFTGEDTVEISCHGGILVTGEVLSAALTAGAVQAEAGEFTRRAFLNGKLSVTAAEALGDLLEAPTHTSLLLAHAGMGGRISASASAIAEDMKDLLASFYVLVDYPDDENLALPHDALVTRTEAIRERLSDLASTYKAGHAVAEGIRTVICGKPNVGKSSLYNAILGRDAAIVTPTAGTTRDILEEVAALGRVTLRLSDTAGIRGEAEASDEVERIGIGRAKKKLGEAELILIVFDASLPLDARDRFMIRSAREAGGKTVAILNKTDLPVCPETVSELRQVYNGDAILLSAEGDISPLREKVEALWLDGGIDLSGDPIVTNARQHAALMRSLEALGRALETLSLGYADDAALSDVEEALSALSELDGRETSEQILDTIFSKFCVGK